jgi:hypothetical protein
MVPEAPNLTTYNKITNGLFVVGVCFPLTMFTHFLMPFFIVIKPGPGIDLVKKLGS